VAEAGCGDDPVVRAVLGDHRQELDTGRTERFGPTVEGRIRNVTTLGPEEHHGNKGWRLKEDLNREVGRFLMLGPGREANVRVLHDVHAVVARLAEHWKTNLDEGAPS
jgi:hypothetical protein